MVLSDSSSTVHIQSMPDGFCFLHALLRMCDDIKTDLDQPNQEAALSNLWVNSTPHELAQCPSRFLPTTKINEVVSTVRMFNEKHGDYEGKGGFDQNSIFMICAELGVNCMTVNDYWE